MFTLDCTSLNAKREFSEIICILGDARIEHHESNSYNTLPPSSTTFSNDPSYQKMLKYPFIDTKSAGQMKVSLHIRRNLTYDRYHNH